ncbi:MAG: AAA family ATPase [Candidatus Methylomirabilia bacterium]
MRCPRCQHENPPRVKFCGECGSRLESLCPSCRTANPPGNKFCNECGGPLAEGPPEAKFASPRAYTPSYLADRILTSRAALEGERKQVTVLFADVKNFTEIAEQLDPEELHQLMDQVFAILLDVIHRYEGTINQFTGDGVMALFGAPLALEDHALRAVEASLQIQERMVEVRAPAAVMPALRIGLNTGRVVVGKIGDDLRMDYTAQGDTVNLAASLQAAAESGTVAMSAATQRLVADSVESVALGLHPVKGKPAPVEVFRPIRSVGRRARRAVSREQVFTPFVGRDEELAHLLELFHEVRAGQPRVVTVIGEAGIGRSRLLLEFKRRISEFGVRWFVGNCVPYGRSTPYRSIVEILRAMLALEGGDAEDVAIPRLESQLAEFGDRGRNLAPALRYILALGPPDPGLSVLSPAERKTAITRGIDGMLMELVTSREPHVFVFEDCQWLDPASADYLAVASHRMVPGPVLFIFTGRAEDDAARSPFGMAGERIVLGPLTPSESWTLANHITSEVLPVDLVTSAVDRTGGNPLFIEEVMHELVETGSGVIPPSVEDVLMARIDRLPPPLKSTLQAASVIGQEFTRTLLERVVDGAGGVPTMLGELVGLGLITETDPAAEVYRFRQPLLQEVTYEELLGQHRKVLHRTIGRAIEELYPNRGAQRPEELARHFTRAEEWPKAVRYHRDAGRKAAALCANPEAVGRLERALELLKHLPDSLARTTQAIDIRLDLCAPAFQLGRIDEVLRLATEAESLAHALGDERRLTNVYSYLSNVHYMKGEPDRSIEYGTQCLRIWDRPRADATERYARQYLGTSYHARGEYRLAEETLTRHIEELERDSEFLRLAQANLSYVASCGWLAFTLADLGEFARADRYTTKGVHAASLMDHPYVQAIASTFAGLVWHAQGEAQRTIPLLETSLDTCRRHQLVVWRPVASAVLGQAYVTLGQVERGLQLLTEAMSYTDQLGVYAYRALWTALLAEGLLTAGQITEALEAAQNALALAVRHKEQGNHAKALQVLGRACLRIGPDGFDEAGKYVRQAIEEAERLHMRPLLAHCYSTFGWLAREQGNRGEARDFLVRARSLARELGMRLWSEDLAKLAG